MNTPKQKAKELIDKMCLAMATEKTNDGYFTNIIHAKQCALIAVEQMQLIMDSLWKIQGTNEGEKSTYLLEVIKEIEKV